MTIECVRQSRPVAVRTPPIETLDEPDPIPMRSRGLAGLKSAAIVAGPSLPTELTMIRRNAWKIASTAVLGGLALSHPASLRAQSAGVGVGAPRSSNERVVTEQPVPRTANSVARDAAEGKLAPVPPLTNQVPGTGPANAADPATRPLTGTSTTVREPAQDPATRLQPAVVGPNTLRTTAASPAGLDVAMLIEHAVGMAIEGSALQAIAEQAAAGDNPADPSRILLETARKEMQESKTLLAQAATDGRDVAAGSPSRRFYAAANNYISTLTALSSPTAPPTPADRAQVAMINHSVKAVLDSGHIRQMGRAYTPSSSLEQLLNHARDMRNEGSQTVMRLGGNGPTDPNSAPSAALLARRGRELVEAADQMALTAAAAPAHMAPPAGTGLLAPVANPANFPQPGAPVGVLRDTRPEIIGGTQATGSPTAGTATGAEAGANVRNPASNAGSGTTNFGGTNNNTPKSNTTGGLPPR